MKNLILSCFFLLLLPVLSLAQTLPIPSSTAANFNCATMDRLQSRPDLLLKQQELEDLIIANKNTNVGAKSGPLPYILPVVVHIIHQNGPENISDAQVLAAIEHLNQAYAHEGYFAQQGDGANTQIQFCLARRDPDGNASTGITRTESTLTNMLLEAHDTVVKNLNRWNPKDYVNIWVVKEISSIWSGAGVAGYAYFPSSHGEVEDGLVCEAKYFGVSASQDAVLIHEIGHYLGLYHTFQGGCVNDDCTVEGDRICDTPPDKAVHTNCEYNSCSTDIAPGSPFSSDMDDFTGDFMDYSPFSCYRFFTPGQATRMQGTIATTRASLLDSKGCLGPCGAPIIAAFSAAPNPVLAGQAVVFTNNSIGATQFSWSDSYVEFSQNQDVSMVFNTVGLHPIVLTATNDDPGCVEKSQVLLEVQCPIEPNFSPSLLEAFAGSTLVFTNTTTGTAPLHFQWIINGEVISTVKNLSFTFQSVGFYTVTLKVFGSFCETETSVLIKITSPCGQFPESVQSAFASSSQGAFFISDVLAATGGFLLQCGRKGTRPMVTKWDESGNVVWHRETTDNGAFNQVKALPGGNFLLVGQSSGKMLLAKIDGDGNFYWSKTLANVEGNYWSARDKDIVAVNPDGSFGVLFIDDISQKRYLFKISAEGNILWSKKLLQLGSAASMKIATNGTGDFVFMSEGAFNATWGGVSVLFFKQSGELRTIHNHQFINEPLPFADHLALSVHADGGYSIFFTTSDFPFNTETRKYLIRCTPGGTAKWAKEYKIAGGNKRTAGFMRQLPEEKGWVAVDTRTDANGQPLGDFLQRLSPDGQILWTRRLGNTPANEDWLLPPVYQSGRLRGIHNDGYSLDMEVLNLPDSNIPLLCMSTVSPGEKPIDLFSIMTPTSIFPYPFTLTLIDAPIVLTSSVLTKNEICNAILPCQEICDNEKDDDGDGYVDCFDTDCDCIPENECNLVAPITEPLAAKIQWESPVESSYQLSTPMVANLNPQTDSIPEIIIQDAGNKNVYWIYQGDGQNKANPVKFDLNLGTGFETNFEVTPLIADIDRNGSPEVIIPIRNGSIAVFRNYNPNAQPIALEFWFKSDSLAGLVPNELAAADFDEDGIPEIYVGGKIFGFDFSNPNSPGLSQKLKGTGHTGYFQFREISTAVDLLSVADCNGDLDCNGLELVAGSHIYSVDLNPADGDGIQIKIKRDLNLLAPGNNFQDGITQVADLNLDGTADVVVTGFRTVGGLLEMGFYVWDKNGLVRFFPYEPNATQPDRGMVAIANVFNDKTAGFQQDFPEIIALQNDPSEILAFNLQAASATPAKPYWWKAPADDHSGFCFAATFDFDLDDYAEIVFRGEENMYALYGGAQPFPSGVDPVTRRCFEVEGGNGTFFDGPVIADVDADGQAEIVYTCSTQPPPNDPIISSGLRVVESASQPWPVARKVWNQFNYFGVNINDDLTVPKTQQKHWLEIGGIGSGNRPFNTHLGQIASINPSYKNQIVVPDAYLGVDSTHCHTDSFEVYLNVCNLGSANLPSGLPIAFYDGDPTSTAAPLLFAPILLDNSFEKGGCKNIKLNIPAHYNTTIFAVINDDGTLPRPFNLKADFPSTSQSECQYQNNIVSFSIQNQTPVLDLGPDISLCKSSVIELSASPGFHKYRWQDGSDQTSFTAFAPGKYWVDAYDACGFWQSDTVNIALDSIAILELPEEVAFCAGEPYSLTIDGFSNYSWSPASAVNCATCSSVEILAEQSTTLVITASTGDCFVTDSIRIRVDSKPTLSFQTEPIPCEGGPGFITANGQGGSGQYEFEWSTGALTPSIAVVLPGNYVVTLTDLSGTGCKITDTVSITTRGEIHLDAIITAVSCFSSMDGIAQALALDGTPPYTWQWENGQTQAQISALAAGTYAVTATDANACTGYLEVEIPEPQILIVTAQTSDWSLCPNESATIQASATGGTPPFNFLWNNGVADSVLTGAVAGNYAVTVTDSKDCFGLGLIEISANPPIHILLDSLVHASGPTHSDGRILVQTSGGTGAFSFLWSNGSTSQNLLAVAPGTYTLMVTDAAGCTQSLTVEVDFVLSIAQAPVRNWDAYLLPNPARQGASAQLIVETQSAQDIDYQLYDAIGRLLRSEPLAWKGLRIQQTIPAPELGGVYWLVVRNGATLKCLKWVVVD